MTVTTVSVERVATAAEATTLVGEAVAATTPNIPSPKTSGDITRVVDKADGMVVGIITKLDPEWTANLRRAVITIEMGSVARMGGRMAGGGRTFGWSPKRVMNGRETCRAASAASNYPSQHEVLSSLAKHLTDQFADLLPDRAAADQTVLQEVLEDWKMEEGALWTSGVINKSATLPYHRDGMNFQTWSAMPSLRKGMEGGHLHLPEYDITFPVRDGEVTWFCGKDLVHGVTPMKIKKKVPGAYRYSIVYYALSGMKDCRTFAEETTISAQLRTERELRMAAEIKDRLAAAREGGQ
ncbi:oxidoreductase [Arthrobacter phage Kharcho]|nr:oxidoreductase [Arthrobacter phage Kharcho]